MTAIRAGPSLPHHQHSTIPHDHRGRPPPSTHPQIIAAAPTGPPPDFVAADTSSSLRIRAPAARNDNIYDFYEGRHASGDDRLAQWYSEFETRFPWPPGWRAFDPRELPNLVSYTDVEIALPMEYEEYARYALSEVNVDSALRGGVTPEEVDWCRDSLRALFDRPMTVLFRGYTSVLTPSTPWHRNSADTRSPE
jgi:hypothetical protein